MENNILVPHVRLVQIIIHKEEIGEEPPPFTMSLVQKKGQHILLQEMADPNPTCMNQEGDLKVWLFPSSSQLLSHKRMEPGSSVGTSPTTGAKWLQATQ